MDKALINIKSGDRNAETINPFIYGNFMEFLENHISGMWAEKIWNRKFDDIIPEQNIANKWNGCGYNNPVEYNIDGCSFSGKSCQKISVNEDKGGERGISQGNINVEKGKAYNCVVHLKQYGVKSHIKVIIGKDYGVFFIPYASQEICDVSDEWCKYSFELIPEISDEDADFIICYSGTGTLWIDEVSLMPDDAVFGWRTDVVDLVKKLKPNIIRFPGGCFADTYHWENAVGDKYKRNSQDNYFWSGVPWDYKKSDRWGERHYRLTESNDVGIDEFMKLCEIADIEPLICVNLGTGNAEEAANWVEYCNGSTDTKYGKKRALNGHPEPYNIKYWEIGNEMSGAHEIGYSGLDGYAKGFTEFHNNMKKVDSTLKFIADGGDGEWNRGLLKSIGDIIDYLDIHGYPGYKVDSSANSNEVIYKNIIANASSIENYINGTINDINSCGYKDKIKLTMCEWNFSAGDWGAPRARLATLGGALFNAAVLNIFQKYSTELKIANFSNLTNAWWGSCIRTDKSGSHVTPQYHVLKMFSENCGEIPLSCSVDCEGYELNGSEIPYLNSMATLDSKNNTIVLSVVNRNIENSVIADIKINDYKAVSGAGTLITLTGPFPESLNDFKMPEAVKPIVSKIIVSNEFTYSFPARSVTLIKLKIC